MVKNKEQPQKPTTDKKAEVKVKKKEPTFAPVQYPDKDWRVKNGVQEE